MEDVGVLKYRVSAQEARLVDHDEQLKQIRKNGHESANALIKIGETLKRIDETNDALNESVEANYQVTCTALERIKSLEVDRGIALERIETLEILKREEETEQKIKARYLRLIPLYVLGVAGIFAAGHSLEMTRVLEVVGTFLKY